MNPLAVDEAEIIRRLKQPFERKRALIGNLFEKSPDAVLAFGVVAKMASADKLTTRHHIAYVKDFSDKYFDSIGAERLLMTMESTGMTVSWSGYTRRNYTISCDGLKLASDPKFAKQFQLANQRLSDIDINLDFEPRNRNECLYPPGQDLRYMAMCIPFEVLKDASKALFLRNYNAAKVFLATLECLANSHVRLVKESALRERVAIFHSNLTATEFSQAMEAILKLGLINSTARPMQENRYGFTNLGERLVKPNCLGPMLGKRVRNPAVNLPPSPFSELIPPKCP